MYNLFRTLLAGHQLKLNSGVSTVKPSDDS
jgi:hypothetical protein